MPPSRFPPAKMTANPLKEYLRLRDVILTRKAEIEAELQELEVALAPGQLSLENQSISDAPLEKPEPVHNPMSLGDMVFSVTKDAPLSKEEILRALDGLGYQFSGESSPMEEIGALLQFDKRFEESNGKYGPTLAALFPEA